MNNLVWKPHRNVDNDELGCYTRASIISFRSREKESPNRTIFTNSELGSYIRAQVISLKSLEKSRPSSNTNSKILEEGRKELK